MKPIYPKPYPEQGLEKQQTDISSPLPSLVDNQQISVVTEEELHVLNRFYKRNGHKGKASNKDHAYWLKEDKKILAAVRFTPTADGILLRGLWVDKAFRQQGIGSTLLQACRPYWQGQDCYCFPYQHLQDFYTKLGFSSPNASTPLFFLQQLTRYQQRGEKILLMQYQPPWDCRI